MHAWPSSLQTLASSANYTSISFLVSLEWSENDVVERYLKPIGMEFMAKAFVENKITGPVLMALTEDHMKELGCAVLGEYCICTCVSPCLHYDCCCVCVCV